MFETRPFTYHYDQPAEYHFCQDSVLFPKFVADRLASARMDQSYRALDVCAGCGVIGLELAYHLPQINAVDFLELQGEFRETFHRNRERAGHGENFRFIEADFARLADPDFAGHYDLIVANPPYFQLGEGRLSPSQFQNRCRFFLDGDLMTLLRGMAHALKKDGVGFFLMKSGARHGRNALRDAMLGLAGLASLETAGDIRGTLVVELKRV